MTGTLLLVLEGLVLCIYGCDVAQGFALLSQPGRWILIVCAAVLIMRKTNPQAERPFRAPFYPFVPILGILTCLLLMFSLPPENWYRLLGWMVLGLVVYFSYGYRHSVLRQRNPAMDSSGAVVGAAGGARRL